MNSLKVKIGAQLISDKETEEKIKNFTTALSELPRDVSFNFAIVMNGKVGENPLKINIADLLINQVKEHFNKN